MVKKPCGIKKIAPAHKSCQQAKQMPPTADQLLPRIQELTEQCDLTAAFEVAERALSLDPNHLPSLEAAATLSLEVANIPLAVDYLKRYYALDQTNDSIILYMGQITEGKESEVWLRRAATLLESQLAADSTASSQHSLEWRRETTRKLADALCSIAEVYMTDLCFEPEASNICIEVLQNAIKIDPSYPQSHQTLTSVYISLSEPVHALETLLYSIELWLPAFQNHLALISDPTRFTEAEQQVQPYVPTFESRISCARLCIELGQYRLALEVLGICVQEFDESVEVWYLFGWLYYLLGEGESNVEVAGQQLSVDFPDDESIDAAGRITCAEWWADAKECLEQAAKHYKAQEYMDEPLLEHVEQLLAAIRDSGVELAEHQVVDADELTDNEMNADWQDVNSEGDEQHAHNSDENMETA